MAKHGKGTKPQPKRNTKAKTVRRPKRAALRQIIRGTTTGLAQQIANSYALPHHFPPLRIPEFDSATRTAVASLNATAQATPLAGNEHRVAVIPSPVAPVWMDVTADFPNQLHLVSAEAYYHVLPTGTKNMRDDPTFASKALGEEFQCVYVGSDYSPSPGATMNPPRPVGVRDGREFAYAPCNSYLGINVGYLIQTQPATGVTANNDCAVIIEAWTKDGYTDMTMILTASTFSATGGSAGTNVSGWTGAKLIGPGDPTWYRIKELQPGTASLTASADRAVAFFMAIEVRARENPGSHQAITAFLPWAPAFKMEYDTTPLIYKSSRSTATGFLVSNVTALLQQEGSVLAGRLSYRSAEIFNFRSSDFTSMPSCEKYNMALQRGLYTFLAPQPKSQFKRHFNTNDGFSVATDLMEADLADYALIHLDSLNLVNTFILGDPSPTTSPTLVNFTLDMHIEFNSVSQLFPLAYTTVNLDQFRAALMALTESGFYYENPSHLAALAAAVKKGLSMAWPYVRPALVAGGRAALSHVFRSGGAAMTQRLEQHL